MSLRRRMIIVAGLAAVAGVASAAVVSGAMSPAAPEQEPVPFLGVITSSATAEQAATAAGRPVSTGTARVSRTSTGVAVWTYQGAEGPEQLIADETGRPLVILGCPSAPEVGLVVCGSLAGQGRVVMSGLAADGVQDVRALLPGGATTAGARANGSWVIELPAVAGQLVAPAAVQAIGVDGTIIGEQDGSAVEALLQNLRD